jgi:hypothetical protein
MYLNDEVNHLPSPLEAMAKLLKLIFYRQRIYIMKIFFTSKYFIFRSACQNETIPNCQVDRSIVFCIDAGINNPNIHSRFSKLNYRF